MAMLADLILGLLTGNNWPQGNDSSMERPVAGALDNKLTTIRPEEYQKNKAIKEDKRNIYDENGRIVDYDMGAMDNADPITKFLRDQMLGIGDSVNKNLKGEEGSGNAFKDLLKKQKYEDGSILGFLQRIMGLTPERQNKTPLGQGKIGPDGSGETPGTGQDPALNPTPLKSQRMRQFKVRDGRVSPPLEPGNIDLSQRPVVNNADGSQSTVLTKSFNFDGKEYLLPTISPNGMPQTDEEAINEFRNTGKHLGVYANPESANAYAKVIHQQQESMLRYAQPTALDPQQIEELRTSLLTDSGQRDPNNPNGLAGRMTGPYSKVDQQGQMDEAQSIADRVRNGYNSTDGGRTPQAPRASFQDALKNKLLGGE